MKTLSRTLAIKLVMLAAGLTVPIVLMSACQKSSPDLAGAHPSPTVTDDSPLVVCMNPPGVEVKADPTAVGDAFEKLIAKHGQQVCNIGFYKKEDPNHPNFSKGRGPLCPRSAVRSEAAETSAAADPVNLVQRVAFSDIEEAQQFFSTINSTATPTPTQ